MKRIVAKVFAIAFGLCVGGVVFAFGQDVDNEKWVQIDDADGLLSFSVPADFVVDKDADRSLDYRLTAFSRGVRLAIESDRIPGLAAAFDRLQPHEKEDMVEYEFAPISKKTKTAKVKKFSSHGSRSYRIFLISGGRYYRITGGSIIPGRTALDRFLESIRVNGNPIENATAPTPFPAEIRLAKDLKTSQEVRDARAKTPPKRTDTYTYFGIDSFKPVAPLTNPDIRPAIVIDQNPPVRLTFIPGEYKIKVIAEFLASGLIGKVVVYSNLQEKLIPIVIEAALGVKFIPAKQGSNFVDSVAVIDYSMNIGKPVIHYNMPIPK
jgi:hypothetical protein